MTQEILILSYLVRALISEFLPIGLLDLLGFLTLLYLLNLVYNKEPFKVLPSFTFSAFYLDRNFEYFSTLRSTMFTICKHCVLQTCYVALEQSRDTFPHWKLLVAPSILLALLTNFFEENLTLWQIESSDEFRFHETLHVLCSYLESVAYLPQYVMFSQHR